MQKTLGATALSLVLVFPVAAGVNTDFDVDGLKGISDAPSYILTVNNPFMNMHLSCMPRAVFDEHAASNGFKFTPEETVGDPKGWTIIEKWGEPEHVLAVTFNTQSYHAHGDKRISLKLSEPRPAAELEEHYMRYFTPDTTQVFMTEDRENMFHVAHGTMEERDFHGHNDTDGDLPITCVTGVWTLDQPYPSQ